MTLNGTSALTRQRCFNHVNREAAAKCPVCQAFYCRECVTEHDGKVLCSSCLTRKSNQGGTQKKRFKIIRQGTLFLGSCLCLWLLFYYFGQLLLTIPSAVHEGTFWKDLW